MTAWAAAPQDFEPPAKVHRVTDASGAPWLVTEDPQTGDLTIQAAKGNTRDPESLTIREEDVLFAQVPAPSRDVGGPDFGLDLVREPDEDDRVQLCGLAF